MVIGEDDILQVVAKWTGIPLKRMEKDEIKKLLEKEEALHRRMSAYTMVLESTSVLC